MDKLSKKISQNLKKIRIKPKWYFAALSILRDIGIIILIMIAILALGIIIYLVAHNNPWQFAIPCPGPIGLGLPALPWELMIILVGLILAIYFLIKKVHFIYRQNNFIILGVILILTICGYFIAEASGLNKIIAKAPVAREIYQRQGKFFAPDRGPVVTGEITKINKNNIIIEDPMEKTWVIIITSDTKYNEDKLKVGDRIQVLGKKDGQKIEAYGIREFNEDSRGFMHGPRMNNNPMHQNQLEYRGNRKMN